jgi:hypothetical protein
MHGYAWWEKNSVGWRRVMKVEDDSGKKEFGAGRGAFFGGKAHEGESSRKMDRDWRILRIGFMRHGGTKAENGGESERR